MGWYSCQAGTKVVQKNNKEVPIQRRQHATAKLTGGRWVENETNLHDPAAELLGFSLTQTENCFRASAVTNMILWPRRTWRFKGVLAACMSQESVCVRCEGRQNHQHV
eukprot:4730780-Amphidinium_carterae.1